MTKKQFLEELESRLKGLPKEDIAERLEFYSEMIEDRIEEGKTEEGAVADIGTVDEVVEQIASETSLVKLVKHRMKPERKIKAWEIVLIVLGFPIWLPLLLVAFVLLLVAYILIWVLVIVTYAVELAISIGAFASLIYFFATGCNFAYLGIHILLVGLGILMFFACVGATKLTLKLTKKIALSIKKKFVSRGK